MKTKPKTILINLIENHTRNLNQLTKTETNTTCNNTKAPGLLNFIVTHYNVTSLA